MAPVFAHGRLRLYLLKLLDEAPRHGYEVIRLLEERFQGLYAPSAGTVYPRLAKLEAEGLVTHTTEGGRKVYSITDAGRAELAGRSGELADLELEIRESVAELAAEIRDDVRGAAGDLRREMRAAAGEARSTGRKSGRGTDWENAFGDSESWQLAKEELRRAKQELKEQARRAKDESRRAREDAQQARRQAQDAHRDAQEKAREEMQRVAKQVQDKVQDHFQRGDWPTGLREGLSEITKELGRFTKPGAWGAATGSATESEPRVVVDFGKSDATDAVRDDVRDHVRDDVRDADDFAPSGEEPAWVHEESTGDPARDLDRLLDRFRDDVRDAARDHGVTEEQLADARRHLSATAVRLGSILRGRAAK
ncbi:helix-turn-helix transcriptional regulator [Streptomyces sp. TRM66268-LWL]|uniref:Helix-turn-helix transcriptional regulator n=1 Tax=Streptomyces polyasparticus TaxID=2767826 RepID=A0ABR7S8F5_9ACTN|nr:PadR family transcriptional regulator [Streptomyces polyasparticus]MBC9711269.1 helix-turn-helix transcriptional regulator [Streptomyces polyasparticus]